MDLTVKRSELIKALSIVARSTKKGYLPILENVLLSADNGGLLVAASDLETTATLSRH